jgi:CheY-like chemotaxis protein
MPLEALLKELRTLYPALVLISLSSCYEQHRAALASGVDACVSKADSPEKLIQMIRQLTPAENR